MSASSQTKSRKPQVAWWAVLLEGSFALVLGFLLLFFPLAQSPTLIWFVGIYLLVKGLLSLAQIFTTPRGWGWKLMIGLGGLVGGIFLLEHPFWQILIQLGAKNLTVSGLLILLGLINLIQAFSGGGFGTGILGLASIGIGSVMAWLPLSNLLALPLVIGLIWIGAGLLAILGALSLYTRVLPEAPPVPVAEMKAVSDTQPVAISPEPAEPAQEYEEITPAEETPPVETETRMEEAGSQVDWAFAETETSTTGEAILASEGSLAVPAAAAAILASESAEPEVETPELAVAAELPEEVVSEVPAQEDIDLQEEPGPETDVEPAAVIAVAGLADEVAEPEESLAAPVNQEAEPVMEPETIRAEETADTDSRFLKKKVEDIEGIGPIFQERLKSIGISTLDELLNSGATRKGRAEIVEKTGISPKLVLRWVNMADLFRVKGIGSEYSELLEAAGVDTVVELAGRKPENLHKAMVDVNNERKLVRQVPTLTQVTSWVEQAEQLPRVIRY